MKKLSLLLIAVMLSLNVHANVLEVEAPSDDIKSYNQRNEIAKLGNNGLRVLNRNWQRAFDLVWGNGAEEAMDLVNSYPTYEARVDLFNKSFATNQFLYSNNPIAYPMVMPPYAPNGIVIDGVPQYFDANGELAVVVPTTE